MTVPLDIEVDFARSTTSAFELRVEWMGDLALSSPFSVPRIVERFVTLGQYGGLAGPEQPPSQSSARLESQRIADRQGFWLIALSNCDPGTTTVLRNVVAFSHVNIAPLADAKIRASGPSDERILKARPPSHFEPLPFPCDIEPESDDVHVSVEFTKRPSEEGRRQVEAVLTAWLYVAAAGGFSPSDEDFTRPFLIVEEEPDWAADEAGLTLSAVRIDDSAYAPLLNALHYIHRKTAPIVRVGIE